MWPIGKRGKAFDIGRHRDSGSVGSGRMSVMYKGFGIRIRRSSERIESRC